MPGTSYYTSGIVNLHKSSLKAWGLYQSLELHLLSSQNYKSAENFSSSLSLAFQLLLSGILCLSIFSRHVLPMNSFFIQTFLNKISCKFLALLFSSFLPFIFISLEILDFISLLPYLSEIRAFCSYCVVLHWQLANALKFETKVNIELVSMHFPFLEDHRPQNSLLSPLWSIQIGFSCILHCF